MNQKTFLTAVLLLTAVGVAGAADKPGATPAAEKPKIQLTLLLDTSSSMDGLINQARSQLWKIVNEFAKSKKDGVQPDLEVALIEYGNNRLEAAAGFVRVVLPLTDDLDKVSDELFKLRTATRGSEEYCGYAIEAASKRLKWAPSDKVFKAIFIAGNEPFTQGNVDPFKACSEAVKLGVTVNTIHCGSFDQGAATGWQKGAQLADGSYVAIDQDRPVVAVKTPVDEKLIKLGEALNGTYVFYGSEEARQNRQRLQLAQDANAAKSLPAAAARAETKGGELYNNAKFDLVDGLEKNEVKLAELRDSELPADLRGKTLEQKRAYVETQAKKRKELQEQIKQVAAERERYIAEATDRQHGEKSETLDSAVVKAVREQAAKKDFKFGKPSAKDAKTGVTVAVQDDDRTLVAKDDKGKTLWTADVIKLAGAPGVGQPVVRHLSLKDSKVTAVYGKHSFADFDLKTGKLLSSGSD
jgi:hypothetical protein